MATQSEFEQVVDPAICPLCGKANHCRLAAGMRDHQQCWCYSVRFSEPLLARVPEPARNRACICKQCWEEAVVGPSGQETSLETRLNESTPNH